MRTKALAYHTDVMFSEIFNWQTFQEIWVNDCYESQTVFFFSSKILVMLILQNFGMLYMCFKKQHSFGSIRTELNTYEVNENTNYIQGVLKPKITNMDEKFSFN